MNDDAILKKRLLNILSKLSLLANSLKNIAIPVLIFNLLVSGFAFYYFFFHTSLGHFRWIIPTLIMCIPLLSTAAIIWVLDSITSVPEAVKNTSGGILTIAKYHRNKLKTLENNKISKTKYLKTVGTILWDATEVVDGIGMSTFLASPIFWFIYLGAFIGSFLFSGIMLLIILLHYLF